MVFNKVFFLLLVTTPGRVDRGHFGPWQTCVETYFGKTKCGDFSKFQPVGKRIALPF